MRLAGVVLIFVAVVVAVALIFGLSPSVCEHPYSDATICGPWLLMYAQGTLVFVIASATAGVALLILARARQGRV